MSSFNTLCLALLVVSNITSAEPPSDSATFTEPSDERIYLAQAANDPARTNKRSPQGAPTDDEALALAALEGLMAQPPERALPILKRVLAGSQSSLVKQRALFVLGQIDAPEAQTLLVEATRSTDPALRAEAIRSIGIGGNPRSLAVLQEIYNAGDARAKKQVLQAWLISGSKDEVYQAALNAKSEEDANDAIRILGAMGASEELRKLGDTKKPGRGLLEAYAIAGDLASLRKIVDGTGELTTRRDAVRKIGIIRSEEARTALREIYANASSPEIKDAALDGMLIGGDEQGVLALYRASKTADEKRALLRTLSHMSGDAALEAIDAALEERK